MQNKVNEVNQNNDSKQNSKKSTIIEWIILLAVFVLLVYGIPHYVIERTPIDGVSMEDTLIDGDSILLQKVSYRFSDPKRYDVVVVLPYGIEEEEEKYVKRIIGLPGETVQIIDGEVWIDGEILGENYGKGPITDPGIAIDPITLEENEYFVLGDNREESIDSRSEAIGPVLKENIIGKAMFRIWPLNKLSVVK